MTLDQIDRLVRQANPVPDLKALEPVEASLLVLDQQRRTDMQTHDRIEVDQEPESPKPGVLIGIAAAAAIVIGVLFLLRPMDDTPVAEAPVDVATSFVEAYAAFDVDRITSLVTADALSGVWGDVDRLRQELRFLEAQGFKLILDSCEEQTGTPSGVAVQCTYDYHAIRSDEIGLGPFSDNWYDLTIQEGKIVGLSDHFEFMNNGFSSQMWEPFAQWVRATHPEDVLTMYVDSPQTMQRYDDESIRLWEQRNHEYVDYVRAAAIETAAAFVEAYGGFDVDEAASYLAPEALSEFGGDLESMRLGIRFNEAIGFKHLLDSCEVRAASSSGILVRCSYDFHALRSDEIGLGPFSGSSFDFIVREGEITRVTGNLNFLPEFSPQVWEPFALWVAENYPDDVLVLYTDASQSLERVTEESIGLWEQRTREYVEVVNGGTG